MSYEGGETPSAVFLVWQIDMSEIDEFLNSLGIGQRGHKKKRPEGKGGER